MPVEYRPIEPDEFDDFLDVDRIGFGMPPRKEDVPDTWARGELERAFGAFDEGRIVGVGRNYSFELTLPGGTLVPAGAVSWIAVLPTHRRRGVLSGMMNALHDDSRRRGEPVSMLTASESSIYGRFGYGIATWRLGITVERAHARFVHDVADDGRVRYLTDDESLKVFPPVYDTARRARAGMVSRPDFWWPSELRLLADDFAPAFRVVHEQRDGTVDGYALYGLAGDWDGGISAKRLTVVDLQTTTLSARAALWRFLFGVDLVHTVAGINLPADDPLPFMLTDSRRVRVDYLNDGLWLCLLDEQRALGLRTYACADRIVLDVHRPDRLRATLELEGGPDGAQCRPTDAGADLALGAQQLASAFLGGVSFSQLYEAGLVDELRPGAVARADAMFAAHPVPAMTSWF
jgi:predicted acetyltransferase